MPPSNDALNEALDDLQDRIAQLEERFNRRYPPQWNCPNCGRRVPEGSTKCNVCDRHFKRPTVS